MAVELGLDPAEVRRKNFIRADEFPWEVGTESAQVPVVYDSGDYEGGLDRALALSEYARWRREQAATGAASGRLIGIGLAAYVMLTGLGPHEGSVLRIDPSGQVTLVTGSSPHGQGTATALAQIVADQLGVAPVARERGARRYGGDCLRGGNVCVAQRGRRGQLGVRGGGASARQGAGAGRACARGRVRGPGAGGWRGAGTRGAGRGG